MVLLLALEPPVAERIVLRSDAFPREPTQLFVLVWQLVPVAREMERRLQPHRPAQLLQLLFQERQERPWERRLAPQEPVLPLREERELQRP